MNCAPLEAQKIVPASCAWLSAAVIFRADTSVLGFAAHGTISQPEGQMSGPAEIKRFRVGRCVCGSPVGETMHGL
jgi:hypothetical protein